MPQSIENNVLLYHNFDEKMKVTYSRVWKILPRLMPSFVIKIAVLLEESYCACIFVCFFFCSFDDDYYLFTCFSMAIN